MKNFKTLLILLLGLLFMPQGIQAGSATHDWPGTGPNANNSLDLDDQGGSFNNGGNNDTYGFYLDGVGVHATLTMILFNGQAVDDGADVNDLGDNGNTDTGEDFSMGSGLQILNPPSLLNPPIAQIGALSDNPLTPLSFFGNDTGLDVEMLSYVENGSDFAIYEYVVTNNTGNALPVKIGLAGDYDVSQSSANINGKDLDVPVVYEFNPTANTGTNLFYAAGLALAGGTLDNYRLGACCDITYEDGGENGLPTIRDAQRLAYFNARPTEECDDGNNTNGDGCSANCLNETGAEVCGNGMIEAGEGCDDGNINNGDGCDSSCRSELCGDANLDAGEECDDGDLDDSNNCSSFCTVNFPDSNNPHYCGNGTTDNGGVGDQVVNVTVEDVEVTISADLGILEPGQSGSAAFCIVGGISNVDGPNAGAQLVLNAMDCLVLYQDTIAVCGNGIQNAGESCDDGNLTNDDGCDSNCSVSGCGNSIQNAGEGCDDGNLTDGDGCSSLCTVETTCGDGSIDVGETCDDGNLTNGDGCSSLCILENVAPFQVGGSGCSIQATAAPTVALTWLMLSGLLGLGLTRFLKTR